MPAQDIKAFKRNIDNLLQHLPDEVSKMNKKIAVNAIARITSRLTDHGKTAEGASLGTYSTKPMSPLFFLGKGLKGADKKVNSLVKKQKKSGEQPGVSYEQWRKFNNLPTQHVTLSFTGETLGDIGVLSQTIDGSSIITTVGSKNSKSKDVYDKRGRKTGTKTTGDVLDDLNDKYGSALNTELLSLSKEEEEEAVAIGDEMLEKLVKNYL